MLFKNEGMHQNVRDYFDRRVEIPDLSKAGPPAQTKVTRSKHQPTWSLQDYAVTPVFGVDATPSVPHKKREAGWQGTTDLSAMNSYLHREHREYFRREPPDKSVWQNAAGPNRDPGFPHLRS